MKHEITTFLTLLYLLLLGCNSNKPSTTEQISFTIKTESPDFIKGGQIINLPKLEKIVYGMRKEEIQHLFNSDKLTFENEEYLESYSNIQLNEYMIGNTPFQVSFKFTRSDSSLYGMLIKNSSFNDNKKYSEAFKSTKNELVKVLGIGENKKDILGGMKSLWQSDISIYQFHFSEYDNPNKSFLSLNIKPKK